MLFDENIFPLHLINNKYKEKLIDPVMYVILKRFFNLLKSVNGHFISICFVHWPEWNSVKEMRLNGAVSLILSLKAFSILLTFACTTIMHAFINRRK